MVPDTQDALPGLIERTVRGIARALGGDCKVTYVKGYPPTVNDPELFRLAARTVRASLGEDTMVELEKPDLGGEDFSFFANGSVIPGAEFTATRPFVDQKMECTSLMHSIATLGKPKRIWRSP